MASSSDERPAAASHTSAQLHDPSNAAELMARLGGVDVLVEYAEQSRALINLTGRNVHGNMPAKGQDPIYRAMGLKNLLSHAATFKPHFDALCQAIVGALQKRGYDVSYMDCAVKSFESAQAKVNVDYHGDSSCLSDAVRGTIIINGSTMATTIREAYGVIDCMLRAETELHAADATFTFMKDRYQDPAGGSYRDWLFLVRVCGFCCELQLNLETAIKIKQNTMHSQYELTRMANRSLLDASMRGVPKMVRIILESNCCDVDCEDSLGFSSIHFAARHGSLEMIKALLKPNRADVLKPDADGNLALFHATMMGHYDATAALCTAVEALPELRIRLLKDDAKFSIQSSWMLLATRNGPEELKSRLESLVAVALSHIDDQFHAAARNGDARSCKILLDKGALKESWRFQPDVGFECTGLDQAIASGSVATVHAMVAAGITCYGGEGTCGKHDDFLRAAKSYAKQNQGQQLTALCVSLSEVDLQAQDLSEVAKVAVTNQAFNCCARLLDSGAKISLEDGSDAMVVFHRVAGKNDADNITMLLALGVRVNAKDINGRTALQVAAAGGCLDVMRILIKHGADLDWGSNDGWHAAVRASQRGQVEALQLLHEAGADVCIKTLESISCAWIAACNGHLHVIKFLATTKGASRAMLLEPGVLSIAKERNAHIFEYLQNLRVG